MSDDHTKLCHPGECRDCEARRARATEQLLDEHTHLLDSIVIVKEPPPQLFAPPQLTDEQREALRRSVTETLRTIQAALEAIAQAAANAAKGFASIQAAFELAPPPEEPAEPDGSTECAHGRTYGPNFYCHDCAVAGCQPHPADPADVQIDPKRTTKYRLCLQCSTAVTEPVHRNAPKEPTS